MNAWFEFVGEFGRGGEFDSQWSSNRSFENLFQRGTDKARVRCPLFVPAVRIDMNQIVTVPIGFQGISAEDSRRGTVTQTRVAASVLAHQWVEV
jgi:hypothetical protein